MTTPHKEFTLIKLYRTIVSIIAVAGLAIGYGIMAYTLLSAALISDAEYLIGSSQNREIKNCEQPTYATDAKTEQKKSDQEIKDCKDKASKEVLVRRAYDNKQAALGG
jgi:hypothetical protein